MFVDNCKRLLLRILARVLRLRYVRGKITISEAAYKLLRPSNTIVEMNVGDATILLDLSEQLLRYIYFGAFEPAERKFVLKYLRSSDIAIDVGANYGILTATMLCRIGNDGHVYAFEPNPSAYHALECLRETCDGRLDIFQLAVSATSTVDDGSKLSFFINPRESMWGSIVKEFSTTDEPIEVKVDAVSLVDFVQEEGLSRVNFIKIDVEGAEFEVLSGLLPLLKEGTWPTILCEISSANLSRFESVLKLINEIIGFGYCTYRINDEGGLVPLPFEKLIDFKGVINLVLAREITIKQRLG